MINDAIQSAKTYDASVRVCRVSGQRFGLSFRHICKVFCDTSNPPSYQRFEDQCGSQFILKSLKTLSLDLSLCKVGKDRLCELLRQVSVELSQVIP